MKARSGVLGKTLRGTLTRALALRFSRLASDTRAFKLVRRSKLPTFALSRVLERMELETAETSTSTLWLARVCYSKSQFLRMFRASMGCSRTNG